MHLSVTGEGAVLVNGRRCRSAKLSIGDCVDLGASRLVRIPAPKGYDDALEFRPAQKSGEDSAHGSRFRQDLDGGMGYRALSWSFVGLILTLFFILPSMVLVGEDEAQFIRTSPLPDDSTWSSGPLHSSHRFIGDDCTACHVDAFGLVRDQECVACHTGISNHVDPMLHKVSDLKEARCASCHKEHNEPSVLVQRDQRECASCHGDLEAHVDGLVSLANATDFALDHPEFKVSLPREMDGQRLWSLERVDVGAGHPIETSNLLFPHDLHLAADGIEGPAGVVALQCDDCHRTDRAGSYMKPISMELHCADCHLLTFDPAMPKRQLPHGEPSLLLPILEEYYSKHILSLATREARQPVFSAKRPGGETRREAALRQEALGLAEQKALEALEDILERTTCVTCHEVKRMPNSGADPVWYVSPVKLPVTWMPKSIFDHKPHEAQSCTSCHEADKSEAATDVLMPDIATCRACHGGQKSEDLLMSSCIDCHEFHLPQHGLMRAELSEESLPNGASELMTQLLTNIEDEQGASR